MLSFCRGTPPTPQQLYRRTSGVLIWGQAVGYKGHGHSWLSQRVHGGCLSIAGEKTICWLFPLVGIVTLPLATLAMAAGVKENNATEFPRPLSSAFLRELLSQSVSPRISISKQNEEVGCVGVYRTGSFTAQWCSYVKAETDEQQVSHRQDRSQPFLTVNEKEYNGYPRRISQIQQQRAVDSKSLHKQRQCDDLI
ncbi:hypothetical protein DPX16_9969 [Anabarilius grahami]|uniref:Uncharacterized protein n=1 Tax=Anabarilius grahami TaxID=495550 RepID=A0A3N0XWN2_ANAGA|nr:hypothetical protein DPX16_9969 [Anabarilius grahami]